MPLDKIDRPLVSVIVPCYNCGEYLAEALDSVYGQTYSNWECVIVDDGSVDNSRQVAQEYVKKDKRYKCFYQTNKGVSVARNNAIANSSGKYILPLDADDKISAKYLEEAVNVLEKNPDIKVVYCKAEFFGKMNGTWNLPAFSIRNNLIVNSLFCSAFYRKDDFYKTKGYSEEMVEGCEDWDFWLSFIRESDEVFQIPEVCFYYRIRENSRNIIDESTQRKIRLRIYNRHKDLYDRYFNTSDFIYDNYLLKNELIEVKTSRDYLAKSNDYLIGSFIMRPYRFFKRLFK